MKAGDVMDYLNEIKEIVDKLQDTDTVKGKDVKAIYNTLMEHIERINQRHLSETNYYNMVIKECRKTIYNELHKGSD